MTTTRRLAVIIALSVPLVSLNGCTAVRDGIASLIGAPTSDQVAAAQAKVEEAAGQVEDLTIRAEEAEKRAAGLEVTTRDTETRKAEVRALYGRLAAQLPELEGAAADAMVETMEGLQRQLRALDDQADQAADLAAGFRAQALELETAARQQEAKLEAAEAELLGFEDATAAAIAGVTDLVSFAGDTAASLGVPAARETASKVREGLGVGLAGALGLTTLAAGRTARRRRLERDQEHDKATDLSRIVAAVNRFDLLKDDETAREGAKEWAGAKAHRTLKAVLDATKADAAAA